MIQTVSGRYSKKIDELINPIKRYGISYFCWQTVSNTGQWCIIGNQPDWLEYSAEHCFYMHDPSLVHPRFYHSGVYYTAAYEEERFQDTIIGEAEKYFDLNYGLVIAEKKAHGMEFAIFAAPNKNSWVINSYLNYMLELKRFISYFKQEMAPVLLQLHDAQVNITKLKPDFDNGPYLSGIAEEPSIFSDLELTQRQRECLHYTLKGMTAKEIAKLLCISHRTVEIHLDNIRKKYGVLYKRDFFLWN
ncbi:helix-turn-helix transcriptional regulator [Legionella santicrucis]|nr:helix-turn-helix transcriptional regulator [Legionella santicrucis]